jgi:hypothetical protein
MSKIKNLVASIKGKNSKGVKGNKPVVASEKPVASEGKPANAATPSTPKPVKLGSAVKQALPDGLKMQEQTKLTHANGAGFSQTRPGCLAFMQEVLERAGASKSPISKSELLAACVARFPEREEAKMKTTIAMQVPSGFMLEKGIIVHVVAGDDGKRYYINAKETRVAKDERKGYNANRDE